MKLTKIHIQKWQQFEDLELDLTYPKGHKLEGQPLKKVCFIGPNGVGKSSLCELISNFYQWQWGSLQPLLDIQYFFIHENEQYCLKIEDDPIKGREEKLILEKTQEVIINSLNSSNLYSLIPNYFKDIDQKVIIVSLVSNFPEQKINQFFLFNTDQKFIIIAEGFAQTLKSTLIALRFDDLEYNENRPEKEKINRFDDLLGNLEQMFELQGLKFEKIDKTSGYDLLFKTNAGELISVDKLSSGTKQLLYRGLPLFYINPSNSVILFDEPETSMFPDFQKKIVDFYSSIGKDNQFFFATHSPIIAGQFEACEIIKLDFDEEGKVVRLPVEENIKLLDLEGVTSELYDFQPNEPMSEEGKEKLERLGDITNRIVNAKSENDLEMVKKLFPKYKELALELQAHTYYPQYTLEFYEKN